MKKKIVHVFKNHRFIKSMVPNLDKMIPEDNIFYIIKNEKDCLLNQNEKIFFESKKFILNEVIQMRSQVKVVFLHSLTEDIVDIGLNLIKHDLKIIPLLWAGEYSRIQQTHALDKYMPITLDYVCTKKHPFTKSLVKYSCKNPLTRSVIFLLRRNCSQSRKQIKLLKSVKYYKTPTITEGIDLKILNNLPSKPLPGYGLTGSPDKTTQQTKLKTNEMLICQVAHSSWAANNHLDTFDVLKQRKDFKVFCPLAYGDETYGNYIEKVGCQIFGNRFNAQRNFLINDKYKLILQEIDVYFNLSLIQFGLGNIKSFIAIGTPVVLHPKNPIYVDLKKDGFKVYNFFDIDINKIDISEMNYLSKKNKSPAVNLWGYKQQQKNLNNIINIS